MKMAGTKLVVDDAFVCRAVEYYLNALAFVAASRVEVTSVDVLTTFDTGKSVRAYTLQLEDAPLPAFKCSLHPTAPCSCRDFDIP